ncbi:MAG TPA: hypothetical protein VKE41_20700 [Roseiflexaceae bacterium]|nr:hypothetical protein [Roseiflexaceae bacterium]
MTYIRLLAAAAISLVLAAGAIAPARIDANQALAAIQPQVGPGFKLPGSAVSSTNAGKYPRVVGRGNQIDIVSNPNGTAQHWSGTVVPATVGSPSTLGITAGKTDYADASIARASDGTLYAAWIVQNSRIALRRKPVGGSWEPVRTVHRTGSFMAQVDIAVSGSGQIFVTWNQDYVYRFTRSTDGGNTWTPARAVSSKSPYRVLRMAAGPGDTVVGAFGSGNGHVYAAVWNGSAFATVDLTPFKSSGDFFAEPGAAIAPNGKVYVAWRSAAGGIYYTERQANGSWPISKLARGFAYGTVGIATDGGSNLHIFWSSDISGNWDLWYAFKPVDGQWQGPLRAPINASILANPSGAATLGARSYGHGVVEQFDGANSVLRYQQFSGETNVLGATPVLDGGAASTRSNSVILGFTNVTGSPDSVRYHWNAPPTDADPWVPFASPLVINGPPGVSPDACSTNVLFTQVRKGSTIAQTIGQDAETFDTGVQAQALALNPNLAFLPGPPNGAAAGQGSPGGHDGDPRYTRDPRFYLSLNGQVDCSGLKDFSVAGVTPSPVPVGASGIYNGFFALPGGSAAGPRTIDVQATDQLGNTRAWSFSMIYDPPTPGGLPVLKSGGNVQADTANSVVRTLTFQSISVNDNLYGQSGENLPAGKQFWGVAIANTTSPTVTVDDSSLQWYPVRVATPGSSFSLQWNLFSGLGYTSDLANKPGDYYVFVRFLDGAGNPSSASLKTKVTLDAGYTLPTERLPMLSR